MSFTVRKLSASCFTCSFAQLAFVHVIEIVGHVGKSYQQLLDALELSRDIKTLSSFVYMFGRVLFTDRRVSDRGIFC